MAEKFTLPKLEDVGEIIAERAIELEEGRIIQIVIGRPQCSADGQYVYCPYQITGSGDEKVRCSFGADSVQALALALYIIDAHLCVDEGEHGAGLNWLGQQILGPPSSFFKEDLDPQEGE